MFIRSLRLQNYGLFRDATFDLRTDVDRPIVLITGNNGAGKTSILEALRVALHGRRAFDVPLGEVEYLQKMSNRFHAGNSEAGCSVSLEFDHVDLHRTRRVLVERTWRPKGQRIVESLSVSQDGNILTPDVAGDLLGSIVPPEIAKYFFFDGERIRELADWEAEDESSLFAAVADLLGLGVLGQLRTDLIRLTALDTSRPQSVADGVTLLANAEDAMKLSKEALRKANSLNRSIRSAVERARANVRRLGVLQHDDLVAVETEIAELTAEQRALQEEAQRAAADVLPLLCAKTLRRRFSKEIESRRQLEDRETVTSFIEEHATELAATLSAEGMKRSSIDRAIKAFASLARGSLIPVAASMPSLSRSDSVWMQRVIEHELPEMKARTVTILSRLRVIEERIALLQGRRRDAPVDDPAGDAALVELERAQRAAIEHEALVSRLREEYTACEVQVTKAREAAKAQRISAFREGRLRERERIMNQVLEALPTLSIRLQASKELRFAKYLHQALSELWHKTDRLTGVEVSFSDRRIALLDAMGELRKHDLSAGEKQLFAIAFIYALARLSGRLMPFVIDTPLGRLDHQHRRRFVSEFLPTASHQVILLSTDTEIVGSLYRDIKGLLANHYELARYNGGATSPVEVGVA